MRALLLGLLVGCTGAPAPAEGPAAGAPPALDRVRIGWQQTWATQGQLAVTLMKTDILAKHGLAGDFRGFSYGGPLNEGALAGEVDVLFTADQPALALAARDPDWGIIGRLMYNRVGLFVPPDSPVQAPAALAGKTVVVPFGAAAHRAVLGALSGAGLSAKGGDQGVQVNNLGIAEVVSLVSAGATDGRWGTVDAAAAWDPAMADLETKGQARLIAQDTVTSVVVMDDDYVAAHPGVDARFMAALAEAYAHYRDHQAEVDAWFVAESALPFDRSVLTLAASVEPNLAPAAPIAVALSPADVASIQGAADFMVEAALLRAPLDVGTVLRPVAQAPR